MVKKIARTYSVENGKVTKTVTLSSTEESPPSQSPASYSDFGVGFDILHGIGDLLGFGDRHSHSPTAKHTENSVKDWLDKMEKDLDESSDGFVPYTTVKPTSVPVKYGFWDDVKHGLREVGDKIFPQPKHPDNYIPEWPSFSSPHDDRLDAPVAFESYRDGDGHWSDNSIVAVNVDGKWFWA